LARSGGDANVIEAMAVYLASHQASDGGWPLASGVSESDVDSTSFSVMFLQKVSADRYAKETARGRAFLDAAVLPDGGLPLSPAGRVSDPWMTAIAVVALATHGFAHRSTLESCAKFLIDAQRPDGTFARSWSLSEGAPVSASVLALDALSHHSPPNLRQGVHAAVTKAQSRLLSTVNPDGGWSHSPGGRSDPISSAYSLMALAPTHLASPVVKRGIKYLLSRQRADGSFVGPPDQVGPRPLPYSIPGLGNAFILLGLAYIADSH
jgi:squalene cyclase